MPVDPVIVTIMAVHNGSAYIAEAIGSLLAQSLPPHRILVIDDGSTDASGACALAAGGGRVTVVATDKAGHVVARNRGIALANDADFIHFFDSDDVMPPSAMAAMHAALVAEPAWDAVFGMWENFWIDALAEEAHNPRLAHLHGVQAGIMLTAGLLRRQVFDRFGPVPEHDTWHSTPLWLAGLRRAGVLFGAIPEKTLARRLHFNNISRQKSEDRVTDLALELHRRARAARAGQARNVKAEGD